MKKIIFTKNAPEPIGPYSQAVLNDNILFCSGQIAAGLTDKDVTVQTKAVCENIIEVLKAAEMKMENVIKTTCFLKTMSDFSAFNSVYSEYFISKPARSCVAVSELPKNALVEIEVIAIK